MLRLSLTTLLLCAASVGFASAQEFRGFSGFEHYGTQKPWNYRVVTKDAGPVRDGRTSERFELRGGDCGISQGYDNCKHDRERTQRGETGPFSALGKDYWYSFSFYIDRESKPVDPVNTIIAEFRPRGPGQINLSIEIQNFAIVGVLGSVTEQQKNDMAPPRPAKWQHITSAMPGHWYDFTVHARWSLKDDGFIDIYLGENIVWSHKGRNTAFNQPVWIQYGLYRSKVKAKFPDKPVPTQIVYIDRVRKGTTRAAVED